MSSTLLYFILALVILITVHEFGHFIVARWCGVKVLRFSLGFGKVLTSFQDKKGTEYALSLFPLGGYVKMLDESEAPVPVEERHLAFNNQSLLKRIAIVLAGPLFNFLFAFLALYFVLVIGIPSLAPIVEKVIPNTPASYAQLEPNVEIISLDGKPISSWREFQFALMSYLGSSKTLSLEVKSQVNNNTKLVNFSLKNWKMDSNNPDALRSLGIIPFIPKIAPVIGGILENSPANLAKLSPGDRIKTMNGEKVSDWLELANYVQRNPGKRLKLSIQRNNKLYDVNLLIGTREKNGKMEGFIGLFSQKVNWPAKWLRVQHEGVLKAIPLAFRQTVHLTGATFSLIGRLFTGQIGLKSLSGPVGIAQGAGDSGRSGFVYYISFLALISISLGVLNLLPIPMLDGGHLFYFVVEMIRGKPLPEEIRTIGLYFGLIFLGILMIVALTNDISRLTS